MKSRFCLKTHVANFQGCRCKAFPAPQPGFDIVFLKLVGEFGVLNDETRIRTHKSSFMNHGKEVVELKKNLDNFIFLYTVCTKFKVS